MGDAEFLYSLKEKVKSQTPPVSLEMDSEDLGKFSGFDEKKEGLGSFVGVSLLIHFCLILLFMIVPQVMKLIGVTDYKDKFVAKEFKSAIRVDMVGLPTKTLTELEGIDATLPVETVEKKAEELVTPEPSDTAMRLPDKKAKAEAEAKKKAKAQKAAAAKEEARKKRLADVRASLKIEQRRKALRKELSQEAEGETRAPLTGNIVSEGYSVTGDVASDMDVYQGRARAHLGKMWKLPGWMEASSLSAEVLLKIAPNGRILSQKFVKKSGNQEFDNSVLNAIRDAEPYPAPPPSLRQTVMEEGIRWGFPK